MSLGNDQEKHTRDPNEQTAHVLAYGPAYADLTGDPHRPLYFLFKITKMYSDPFRTVEKP